jgi:chromosomal replication initiator protein
MERITPIPMINLPIKYKRAIEQRPVKREIAPVVKKRNTITVENMDIRVKKIIEHVIRGTEFTVHDVFGKSRTMELVSIRHLAMYLCSFYTEMSLIQIGKNFNRDHSTVIHAKESVKNQAEFNKRYARLLNILESEMMYERKFDTNQKLSVL